MKAKHLLKMQKQNYQQARFMVQGFGKKTTHPTTPNHDISVVLTWMAVSPDSVQPVTE